MQQPLRFRTVAAFHGDVVQGQLTFEAGHVILVKDEATAQLENGWGYGRVVETNQTGWFPASFVQLICEEHDEAEEDGGDEVQDEPASSSTADAVQLVSPAMHQPEQQIDPFANLQQQQQQQQPVPVDPQDPVVVAVPVESSRMEATTMIPGSPPPPTSTFPTCTVTGATASSSSRGGGGAIPAVHSNEEEPETDFATMAIMGGSAMPASQPSLASTTSSTPAPSTQSSSSYAASLRSTFRKAGKSISAASVQASNSLSHATKKTTSFLAKGLAHAPSLQERTTSETASKSGPADSAGNVTTTKRTTTSTRSGWFSSQKTTTTTTTTTSTRRTPPQAPPPRPRSTGERVTGLIGTSAAMTAATQFLRGNVKGAMRASAVSVTAFCAQGHVAHQNDKQQPQSSQQQPPSQSSSSSHSWL